MDSKNFTAAEKHFLKKQEKYEKDIKNLTQLLAERDRQYRELLAENQELKSSNEHLTDWNERLVDYVGGSFDIPATKAQKNRLADTLAQLICDTFLLF